MSGNSEAFEDNKTEMLEDEEMPTFLSVSSSRDISLPYTEEANIQLLPIDSTANPSILNANSQTGGDDYEAQSQSPSTTEEREEECSDNDEDKDGSVYVLSSGDDADDPDPFSRSYDEDGDEEDDVDEEDDEDIDDMDEMDNDEVEMAVTEDGQLLADFSEEEIEREDIRSDDLALRSDKPLPMNNEKRSRSLQDLSEYGMPRCKSFIAGGNKYNRVQSKVKRYIQDLKEKNRRRSVENRIRVLEDIKKCEELEIEARAPHDQEPEEYVEKLANKERRSIKDYAEQALKDLEIGDESHESHENAATINEEENFVTQQNNNLRTKTNSKTENDFKCEFKTASEIYRAKKNNMNGEMANDGLKNLKVPKGITVHYAPNGQTQGQNILDVRSIGYDEYMRGSLNSGTEKNFQQNLETAKKSTVKRSDTSKPEILNTHSEMLTAVEKMDVQTVEVTAMEVVDHPKVCESSNEIEKRDKINGEALAKIAMMQTQLNQKTTQCREIREAYQRTLSENFQLKQELEDLKKSMNKLSAKKPAPVLVAVAIQTDPPPPVVVNETKDNPTTDNLLNPKLSASSIGSAVSNNEHWTESVGSLPTSNGSIRPLPNLTPLSNAEDSFIGVTSTPPRTPRQPSHAFQTSSKIIKMLSSITQRKSKVDATVNGEDNSENIFGNGSLTPGVSSYNTPISHRVCNKRKASEMPENAHFLQPPKIAHTSSSGMQRSQRKSKSEFKYPGDYIKINSHAFVPQSSDAKRHSENPDDSRREEDDTGDDPDSGVKCFTYREDENSLETSFLIQAEDEVKTQDGKTMEQGSGVVRECGPYLLGNVEVRMTEFNGTINIWGKEVSQETTTAEDEPEEVADIEEELNERRPCGCWQKTPNARNLNPGPMSCSTNKKQKFPPLRLSESGYLRNYSSPSTSNMDSFKNRQFLRNFYNDGNCRSCDSPSNSRTCNKFRRNSPTNFAEEEKLHNNLSNNYYGCNLDNENCDYTSCSRVSRHHRHHHHHHDGDSETPDIRGTEGCSRLGHAKDNEQSKTEENFNRSQSSRFTNNFHDDNVTCRHGVRKNTVNEDDDDVFKRPSTSNARVNDGYCKDEDNRSNCPLLNNHSSDSVLSHHSLEAPESRRRRSSGKRVRGILMDFLRGCGDCRTTNIPENKISPGIVPQIRVRSTTPPPALTSQTRQRRSSYGSTSKRCVHMECCATCSRRIEMAAEIETQLEIFGAEMERLRSRSQAVLGMLNTLHSTDTN